MEYKCKAAETGNIEVHCSVAGFIGQWRADRFHPDGGTASCSGFSRRGWLTGRWHNDDCDTFFRGVTWDSDANTSSLPSVWMNAVTHSGWTTQQRRSSSAHPPGSKTAGSSQFSDTSIKSDDSCVIGCCQRCQSKPHLMKQVSIPQK